MGISRAGFLLFFSQRCWRGGRKLLAAARASAINIPLTLLQLIVKRCCLCKYFHLTHACVFLLSQSQYRVNDIDLAFDSIYSA